MMNYESPLRTRLLCALVASIMGIGLHAAPGEEAPTPKLVIGIVVEDLKEEYINLLRQHFTQGGFNKMLNGGVLLQNVDYGTNVDAATATAMLYTGAAPSVNGIAAATTFDRTTLQTIPVFSDPEIMGNYTTQTLSPMALLTSTIADEVRIAGDGLTYAYAIAPDAAQALIMAGHAGNCGLWVNDANDCWATTTHYKELPLAANSRNLRQQTAMRIDSIAWTPLLDPNKYTGIPRHLTASPFRYTFNQKGGERMQAFKNSPYINSEITELAIAQINEQSLGSHDGTDMLSLAYTLEPYAFSKNPDNRYETIDAYYRLDRDLQRLLETVDKKVGLPNTLIFIASTPAVPRSRRDDERWRIPYGQFSTRKAMSLLNLYLAAMYGNGTWVNGYHNGEFYLNRDLIKQQDHDLATVRQQVAAFLAQMTGVSSSYSLDDIFNNRAGVLSEPMRRNINIQQAGDVSIAVLPGWEILDDYNYPTVKPNQVQRIEATTAPLLLMAPGLAPQTIGQTVDARQIAPTVTHILRIRSPNGAALPALTFE